MRLHSFTYALIVCKSGGNQMKPIIGITAYNYQDKETYVAKSTYINAILLSGGIPILIPYSKDRKTCKHIIEKIDGLLLPGGIDITPGLFGEEPIPEAGMSILEMDLFEIELITQAMKKRKPILAICRGIQILNVSLGGTLYQDIHAQGAASICHSQYANLREEKTHSIVLNTDSFLYKLFQVDKLYVNSFHHEAIKDLGKVLLASAYSVDHILEACESKDGRVIGVQWHPETLFATDNNSKRLFQYFISIC